MRRLLLAYALLNSVLYSMLMPLWEGFDEPFHFGYVQHLANGQGFPDPRTTKLSREIAMSLTLAPASHVVKGNLPQVRTYAEYFSLPLERRLEIRQELSRIPRELRWQQSDLSNYEAHHAPLAYLLMAGLERLLGGVPITMRVLILRIIVAITGSLLLGVAMSELCKQVGMPELYCNAALFCVLSLQMIWATVAHVANDWLALPVAAWTLVFLIRYSLNASDRNAVAASAILSVGLLTKAYMLAFVPLLFGLVAWRRQLRQFVIASVLLVTIAGPWYARNIWRYGDLTGMQESRAGIGLGKILDTGITMDWLAVAALSVRSALWTGNNTFSSFSANTLNAVIGVCFVALILWACTRHSRAEWIVVSYCALFLVALAYNAASTYVYTGGRGIAPSPWYAQVLAVPGIALCMLGASKWGSAGKVVVSLMVFLFGYLLAASYAVKFIPLYGGCQERTSLTGVWRLYSGDLQNLVENLSSAILVPAELIFALTLGGVVLIVAQQVFSISSLLRIKD